MMLLIALGITVAFLASWAATVGLVHPAVSYTHLTLPTKA